MRVWRPRRSQQPARAPCARCAVPYDPTLTRGDCPVCGLAGDASLHLRAADAESRPVVLAVAAMAVNLVVFALVAWAVLG